MEKAARYRKTYEGAVANQPLCLGSYAFTWGNKQEATATWFGMLLPDGSRLAAVDTMQELWTGKPPANRVPELRSLQLDGTRVSDFGLALLAGKNLALLTVPPAARTDLGLKNWSGGSTKRG